MVNDAMFNQQRIGLDQQRIAIDQQQANTVQAAQEAKTRMEGVKLAGAAVTKAGDSYASELQAIMSNEKLRPEDRRRQIEAAKGRYDNAIKASRDMAVAVGLPWPWTEPTAGREEPPTAAPAPEPSPPVWREPEHSN